MKMQVLAVHDAASGVFARPIFVASIGVGIRMFGDEVQRQAADNEMFKHPEDFSLFHLGEFDDNSGCFDLSGNEVPVRIAAARDFVIVKS